MFSELPLKAGVKIQLDDIRTNASLVSKKSVVFNRR